MHWLLKRRLKELPKLLPKEVLKEENKGALLKNKLLDILLFLLKLLNKTATLFFTFFEPSLLLKEIGKRSVCNSLENLF